MSWEHFKPEAIVGIILAAIAAIWKFITMFFNMKSDIEKNASRIDKVESDLQDKLLGIKEDIKDHKSDLLRLSALTEVRHTSIEKKLDRLIEKFVHTSGPGDS